MNEAGTLLAGRYRLLEKIAAGGSAFIYTARDEKTDRIVAVKILKPELTDNAEFIQRFKKEVQASLKLRHANITRAYDAGLDNGRYYIVMEFIRGTTLKNLIQSKGPLPEKYVVSVAKKLCLALEYAHVKGFIHRDIKPHNVLLDEKGEPYIADFGIARNIASNTITSDENSVMGSVHYFSPEQARGERVDKRTDIYSLGILIYEMLTGKVPFDADTSIAIALKHINEPMPDLARELPHTPDSLNRIIQKATQKDKHFRYRTAFSMYEDLMRALSDPGGDYVKYTESKRSKQPINTAQFRKQAEKKHKRWVVTGLGACSAGILVVWLMGTLIVNRTPVPVVVGYGEDEAGAALEAAGFDLEVVGEISDQPVGVVIRQSPEAGSSAAKGSLVQVFVSEGAGAGKMPNVTDMPFDRAQAILEEMGLHVSIVEQTQGTSSIGYVIGQDPMPGVDLGDSDEALLTVKTAPEGYEVPIPDVTGQMIDSALAQMRTAGITELYMFEEQSENAPPGTVIAQTPDSGTVSSDDPVALYVALPDGPLYAYPGEVNISAQEDGTQVQVSVIEQRDGMSVRWVVADAELSEGMHNVSLDDVPIESNLASIDVQMLIVIDGSVANDWQVTLERVDQS